ncbi:YdcF family protein [Deinococcus navajonensis]|uniref:YdcF family protein n=1 Tax=Deinococcus navajonensis TaxID=309884 RepID=A0ABV8XN98_9DEIO
MTFDLKAPVVHHTRPVLASAALGLVLATLAAFLGELRAPVSLLVALVLGSALAGAWRASRRVLWGGGGLLAAALGLCLLTPVLRAPLAALSLAQPPAPADAIVVLGGGVQCGTAAQTPASAARLIKGLTLWRAGFAPVLIVSEPSGLLGPADCPNLSALQRAQITALYPHDGPQVLNLHRVTTTRDEAARVKALVRSRGWRRVLLVTSPSHSRRAATLFEASGVPVLSVPAEETLYDTTLPLPSDRLYALRTLLYEGLSRLKAALGATPER